MLTRGSLKRKGAPALTATSLANDDLYDLSIHHLISRRLWSAIIERVRAHPTIVRKTTPCINGGYFTILHTIMMQGPGMPCQDVVPVIKAILTAADQINYTAKGQQMMESEDSGSWALLLDNNNHEGVSSFHLLCECPSFWCNVPMSKVLLQMGKHDDIAEAIQYQKKIFTLCDNDGCNILHRVLRYSIRTNLFMFIRFVVAMAPALLNQRDNCGLTPLDIAVAKSKCEEFHDKLDEYRVIKLLVYCSEFYARDRLGDFWPVKLNEDGCSWSEITDEDGFEIYIAARRNVLHTACLLPQYLCTLDLIRYLSNRRTTEARDRFTHKPLINMATEVDENGNRALHLFLSNKRWSGGCINDDGHIEIRVIFAILVSDRTAIFRVNGDNMLPLQLAMQAGRRRAITTLILWYPQMALRVDDIMSDTKLVVELLSLVTQGQHDNSLGHLHRRYFLNALFVFLRGRPETFSHYH